MYGRRVSPFSRIGEIERSRSNIISLVMVTIGLAVVINVFSGILYRYLEELALWLWPGGSIVLLYGGLEICVLVIVATTLLLIRFGGRQKTPILKIDLAAPYVKRSAKRIDILRQHAFRPPYDVVRLAYELWTKRWGKAEDELAQLAATWAEPQTAGSATKRKPIQNVLGEEHLLLVEAILLHALHRYSESSLEPGSRLWRRGVRN